MKAHLILASAATLALAACGGDTEADGSLDTNMAVETGDNMADATAADANLAAATARTGQEYAAMAAAGDMFEIESAQLAVEKSQDAELKALAQMIIADHRKSTEDLKAAVAQAQPPITVAPALTAEQQANMEALRAASGDAFDRLWVAQQIPAHEKTLALVQDYAANGDVPSLRQHASTVAAPVQRHLEALRNMRQ